MRTRCRRRSWSYTSFEATLLQVSRTPTRWVMLAVMLLGLFMNSSLSSRLGGRRMVVRGTVPYRPAGARIVTTISAPTRMLREHYVIMLGWIVGRLRCG